LTTVIVASDPPDDGFREHRSDIRLTSDFAVVDVISR